MKLFLPFFILIISFGSAQEFHESTTIIMGTGERESTFEFQEYNSFYKINFIPNQGSFFDHNREVWFDYDKGHNIKALKFETRTTYLNQPWFWNGPYKPFGR